MQKFPLKPFYSLSTIYSKGNILTIHNFDLYLTLKNFVMKNRNKLLLIPLVIFIGLQFFRPEEIVQGMVTPDLANIPKPVSDILRASCFDCHSSKAELRWYDKMTPANFLVASHIREGRAALDFSRWSSWPKAQQNSILYYSVNKILSGEMPISSYAAVHPSTKLSNAQINILKNYARSVAPRKTADSAQTASAEKQYNQWIKGELKHSTVKASPNGLQYIPEYRNWKAISTTDRFDNGTMRIIFANEVAVKAIQNKKTNPWPDGTVFAKTAWKQRVLREGSVATGEFLQVEFMVKDAGKYCKTNGWGWGRWKGSDLKPYGDTPDFDRECMECHKPMSKKDYVFTSPLYLISQLKKIQK